MDMHGVETRPFRVLGPTAGGGNRERTVWMSGQLEGLQGELERKLGGRGGPRGLEPPLQHEFSVLQQQLSDLSKILRSSALSSASLLRTFHNLVLRAEMFLQQLSDSQPASQGDDDDNDDDEDEDGRDEVAIDNDGDGGNGVGNEDSSGNKELDEGGDDAGNSDVEMEGKGGGEENGDEGKGDDEAGAKSKTTLRGSEEDEELEREVAAPERRRLEPLDSPVHMEGEGEGEGEASDMDICDSPPGPPPSLPAVWGFLRKGDIPCQQQQQQQQQQRWREEGEDAALSQEASMWQEVVSQFRFIQDCAEERHQELMAAVDEYRRFRELGDLLPIVDELVRQHDRVVDLAARQVTPLSPVVTDLCHFDAQVEQLCRALKERTREERKRDKEQTDQWEAPVWSRGGKSCKGKGVGKRSKVTSPQPCP